MRFAPLTTLLLIVLLSPASRGLAQTLISTTTTYDGVQVGLTGTLSVDGSGTPTLFLLNGTTATAGLTSLTIGNTQSGALSIAGGSTLMNSSDAYIAKNFGSTGRVNITGINSLWDSGGALYLGYLGSGTLTIANGGRVNNNFGYLGLEHAGQGTATITGANSTWSLTNSLFVGVNGMGTLSVQDGGRVRSIDGLISYGSGGGTATISGANSEWNLTNFLFVGVSGSGAGILNVQNGGRVSSYSGYIGNFSTGQGTATISGANSQWSLTRNLYVGYSGSGALNVQNGGAVRSYHGVIGSDYTGRGTATIAGANSQWSLTGNLYVGSSGTGVMNIQDGGTVVNMTGQIGFAPGSNGSSLVSGVSSIWTVTNTLYVGGGDYGSGGIGQLTITDRGTLQVGDTLRLWNNGTLTIGSGGSVTARNFDKSVGTLNFSGGTLTVSGGTYTYAAGSGTAANILTIDGVDSPYLQLTNGATVVGAEAVIIGSTNSGQLLISGGSMLTNAGSNYLGTVGGLDIYSGDAYLGLAAGSSGTATITGAGSQWTSDFLNVGFNGNGVLNIQDSGRVAGIGGLIADGNSNGRGVVTVSGSGSQWNTTSFLTVGAGGTGTLDILNGGSVSTQYAYVSAVYGMGSGAVRVDGAGSQLSLTSDIYLAWGTDGTLRIENGGSVTSRSGLVGIDSIATGTASIDGVGSRWTVTDGLTIGDSGRGTLQITQGGTVSSRTGYVGNNGGSVGTAMVSGAGSQWTVTNALYIGGYIGDGTGRMTVTGGGTVSVGDTFKLWGDGTLTIGAGGGVTARNFDNYFGTIAFSGGTLTISGGTYTHAAGSGTAANILTINGVDSPLLQLTHGATVVGAEAVIIGFTNSGRLLVSGSSVLSQGGSALVYNAGGFDIYSGTAVVGLSAGSSGTATITGAGSQWRSADTLIGLHGNGVLDIQDGGSVESLFYGGIGEYLGATGTATISGANSRWTIGGALEIGFQGRGTLHVADGGRVETGWYGTVGSYGTGTATISGANSQWTMGEELYVGVDGGQGTLHVVDGGRVESRGGYLGYVFGSIGTATVSGSNSQWSITNGLYIGGSEFGSGDTGRLTITDGGSLNVGGTLKLWNNGTLTIGSGGSVTARNFDKSVGTLAFSGGTLTVSGGTYTHAVVSGTAANVLTIDGVDSPYLQLTTGATVVGAEAAMIGFTNSGQLLISGGSVLSHTGSEAMLAIFDADHGFYLARGDAIVGGSLGSTGTVTVSGTGSLWQQGEPSGFRGRLRVGLAGTGVLNVLDGGRVQSNTAELGFLSTGQGTATVSGTGSQWTVLGYLDIGTFGTGVLNIVNGGRMQSSVMLGNGDSGHGTATVSGPGSQWIATGLSVGGFGTGVLNILNGGQVQGYQGILGEGLGHGSAIISGTGSRWSLTNHLIIGSAGTGVLSVEDAGTLVSQTGLIGFYPYSGLPHGSGTATIQGAASAWTVTNALYVGGSGSASGGTGNLTVTDGGSLNVGGTLKLWNNGTLTIGAGGSVATKHFDKSAGTLAFSGGTLTVSGGIYTHALVSGTAANILTINGADTPLMQLINGATVVGAEATVIGATNSGQLLISGSSVLTQTVSFLPLGDVGGQFISSGQGFIGLLAGSTGTATVTGTGSQWNLSEQLFVGYAGDGTLNVQNSGVVRSNTGQVGTNVGSTGTATISGVGSRWTMSGNLWFGPGRGTLNVLDGGQVVSHAGIMGADDVNAAGTATISDTGSQWSLSDALFVGRTGSGTLVVQNGGQVTSNTGYLGYFAGATGRATISGQEARWSATTDLFVGGQATTSGGTGSMTITGGGTVSVGGLTKIWATTGSLTVGNSGTLATGALEGNLRNDGLVAFNPSGTTTYSDLISGAGNVTINTGTVAFAADQTYTGVTTIASGAQLLLGKGGTGGGVASATIVNQGLLAFNRSGASTYAGTISASGGVAINTGNVAFVASQSYSGGTSIAAGASLTLTGAGGAIVGNVSNSGTIIFGRSQTFGGAISGNGGLTVAGGTLTLINAQSYVGATSVANGSLVVNGSLVNTAVGVAAGASLSGTGSIAGVVSSSGTISAAGVGTLSLGGLILSGGTLSFGIGSTNATSGHLLITGSSAPMVSANVILNIADLGGLAAGTYQLISGYGSNLLGATDFGRLLLNQTLLGGFNLSLTNRAGELDLLVSAASNDLTWVGGVNNTWNTATANWTGDATVFSDDVSNVVFGNSTGTNTVLVSGTVHPTGMTVNNNASHNYVFSGGDIVSTGSLTKTGDGSVTFTNNVAFAGGAVVNGGTLQIGNGGTSGSFAGNIENKALVIFNRSDAVTYSNVISGSGAVAISTGDVTFATNQTYGGVTTVATGANLYLGNGGSSGSVGGAAVNDGSLFINRSGTVALAGLSGTGTVTITTAAVQINNGGPTASFSGTITNRGSLTINRTDTYTLGGLISGTGAIIQAGSGTTIITGTRSSGGQTIISGGTLQVGNGGTTGILSGTVANNGLLVVNRSNFTSLGAISGTGGLVKLGNGTLQLTGNNTYSGDTTISDGFLVIGSNGSIVGNISHFGGGLNFSPSGTYEYGGVISGTGNVTNGGTGVLVLSGVNTFTGRLQVNDGLIRLANNSAAQFSTVVMNVSNNLEFATGNTAPVFGALTATGNIDLQDSAGAAVALHIGNNNSNQTYYGVISGPGSVTKIGTATQQFDGANTYTGETTILAGAIRLGNNAALHNSTVAVFVDRGLLFGSNVDAPTIGGLSGSGAISLTRPGGASALSVGSNHASTEYSGALSGTGSLIKIGSGILILSGNNIHSGGTTISNGTLQIGNGGSNGSITGSIINNALLIFNHSNDYGFEGNISGNGSVRQQGSGVLTLDGLNNYTGGTYVDAGTVVFGDSTPTGPIHVADGASVRASGGSLYINDLFVNNGTQTGTVQLQDGAYGKGSGNYENLVVNNGATFSPGNSPGTTDDASTTWNGGTYAWEINRLSGFGGTEGSDPGWDLWNTGLLSINGPFVIAVTSLTSGNVAGALANWNPNSTYDWRIATSSNGAFASLGNLSIDVSPFAAYNNLGGGAFSLFSSNGGNNLHLQFSTVPEPSSMILGSLIAGGFGWRLRRRRSAKSNPAGPTPGPDSHDVTTC